MTSQPGQRRITKFGRVIFLFKNHAENETKRRVPDLFLFFKKAL